MIKNGKKVLYVNFNNFVEATDDSNMNQESVISQIPDKIRYYSKNYWTLKRNNLVSETKSNALIDIQFLDDTTLYLRADKQKFSIQEVDTTGLLVSKFSRASWENFLAYARPEENEFYEDFYSIFLEPVNYAENDNAIESGISYINKEYFYNFYSPKYESATSAQIFDVKQIPSAYALLDDSRIDVRTRTENLFLSLGGIVSSDLVDSLQLSKNINNTVKKYFEELIKAYSNPNYPLISQEIRTANENFIISKEKNNLTKTAKGTFLPFPYYFYTEFSNLSPDKNDFINILAVNNIDSELLNYVIDKQDVLAKEFVYSGDLTERRNVNFYDFKEFVNNKISTLTQSNVDDLRPLFEIVSFTDLINYINDNIKPKQRNYKEILTQPAYNEVLFYKIEKRQFNYSSNIIQTFWVLPNESSIIKFFDTQIKYGTEYFYTIYAYTLCVGSQYTYKPYQYESELARIRDLENGFYKIKVETKPSYQVLEIPFANFTNAVFEPPYTKPIVDIKLDNEKIRFIFEQSPIESLENPQVIETSDLKIYENIKLFQQNENQNLIKFVINNDINKTLQIYRTTTKPANILSFQGKLYKTITLSSNANTFLDNLVKNVKYYYLFRFVNNHNTPSNASKIYEIELVDEDGYQVLRIKNVDLSGNAPRKDTKEMKKYLLIRPSIIQTRPSFGETVTNIDQVDVGPTSQKVWNKDFILRVTSKKTKRVLEFNLSSIINKKN